MYLTDDVAKQKVLAEKYGGVVSDGYRADCARIDSHEPWEYILGYADFLGCKIDLSYKPMVPRDETAFWVQRVIEEWKGAGAIKAIDLYAGSGNIGVALLKHLPDALVTFNEIDAALMPQIATSITVNGIDASRATLIAGNSLEKITGTFDVICANPPYVDPRGEANMDPEMRFEPHIAFFGSKDGFGHHRELIREGKKYLTPQGVLCVECDMTQVDELKKILESTDWNWQFWNDPYGHEGVMVLRP
ncbi:MAG: Protoporphirogen oxidase [Parcubacteria group bacterium]|nr:Protoporphirogen oxidase [Parcubacteria group bacterium]